MIGLGGAEFRLPLLTDVFGFVARAGVIVNSALLGIVGSGQRLLVGDHLRILGTEQVGHQWSQVPVRLDDQHPPPVQASPTLP